MKNSRIETNNLNNNFWVGWILNWNGGIEWNGMKSIKCDIVRFWRVWLLSHFHVKTPRHDKNCKAVNFKSTIYVHFWLYFFPSFILVILMLITFWVSATLIKNRKSIFPHKLKQIKNFYCPKVSFFAWSKDLNAFYRFASSAILKINK